MTAKWRPRVSTVWLMLLGLTNGSVLLAEGATIGAARIVGIFVIAAVKSELVLQHFMEAARAERHWRWLYRLWIGVITLMLIVGHTM
jgi:hypothetical protein